MQNSNDYDRDVFNGDVGFVSSVSDGKVYVDFPAQERKAGALRPVHLQISGRMAAQAAGPRAN